jgi:FMN-dependent NADH-azoreductase
MSRHLLHLSVSARDDQSFSRPIGRALVEQVLAHRRDLALVRRDLGQAPLPHPSQGYSNANIKRAADRDAVDADNLVLSEELLKELLAAELIVIDTPMHNFTVPSALKAWIDYVVRPGCSFASTPEGKRPLLADRPVRVIVGCGSNVTGAFAQQDFLTPYLRYVFAIIGLTDIDFLVLERLGRGDAARALAQEQSAAWIATQVEALITSKT